MTAYTREVVDSLTIRSLRNNPALPQAYNRTAIDGLTAGDAATRAQALARAIADSITRDAIPGRTLATGRAVADARSQADAATASTLTLQQRIDAAAPGSTLTLTGLTFTTAATVNKALTIVGGTLNYTGTGAGLTVTANNVTINGMTLTGQGYTTFYINNAAIRVTGTSGARITGLVITGCTISGWSYGVDAFYTSGQNITGNTITNIAYAGVMVHSALNGYIQSNNVSNVGVVDAYGTANPSAQYNAYGLVCTRNSSGDARSTGVIVQNNTVDNVPNWHGLDTHAGDAIQWLNNTVTRCNRGLFITGDGFGGVSTDNVVTGNSFANPTRYPGTAYGYNQRAMTLISGTTGTTGSGNLVDGHPFGEDISGNTGTNSITGTTVTNPY